MDMVIEISVETRKEWSAPELKKVDIEQITAGGSTSPFGDGGTFS
jgi:hypothetical protein